MGWNPFSNRPSWILPLLTPFFFQALQELLQPDEILPGRPLFAGRSQIVGRVEAGNNRNALPGERLVSGLPHRPVIAHQGEQGKFSQAKNGFGLNGLKLINQKVLAQRYLFREGVAVPRRSTLDHIGDVDLLSGQANRVQHFIEQLAGCSNKRLPHSVLVGSWPLSNKDNRGIGIAYPKDSLAAGQMKLTPSTVAGLLFALCQQTLFLVAFKQSRQASLS